MNYILDAQSTDQWNDCQATHKQGVQNILAIQMHVVSFFISGPLRDNGQHKTIKHIQVLNIYITVILYTVKPEKLSWRNAVASAKESQSNKHSQIGM